MFNVFGTKEGIPLGENLFFTFAFTILEEIRRSFVNGQEMMQKIPFSIV